MRHINTQSLWIQENVRTSAIELRKVRGDLNPADLFTKYLPSGEKINNLVRLFSCEYRGGRAEAAPQLRRVDGHDGVHAMGEFEEERFVGEFVVGNGDVEAKAHDPSVLPHHYGNDDIDHFFPKVHSDDDAQDEFPDFDDEQFRRLYGGHGVPAGIRGAERSR